MMATDSDFSDGFGPNKLKTYWNGFTVIDAIKNICDSWEEVKISTLTGIWKKLIPTLMDEFEEFKNSNGSDCTCGRNSKRIGIRSGAWSCNWNAVIY